MYTYSYLYNNNGYNCHKYNTISFLNNISVANVLAELSKYDMYNKENSVDGMNQVKEERWIKDNIFKIYKGIMGNNLKRLEVGDLAGYLYLIYCYLHSDEYKKQIREIEKDDPYLTKEERKKLDNSKIKLKDELEEIMRDWHLKTNGEDFSNNVSAAVTQAMECLNDFKNKNAENDEKADRFKRNKYKMRMSHPDIFNDDIFKGCQFLPKNGNFELLKNLINDTHRRIEIDLKREAIYYDDKIIDNLVIIKKLCTRIHLSVSRYEIELRKELKRECSYISNIIDEFLASTLVKQNS